MDDDGKVVSLHEVLFAELGEFEPIDAADAAHHDEYRGLAAEAAARRELWATVAADKNVPIAARDAACQSLHEAETRCLNPLYKILNRRNRSALCFSGGGIRSATFCLGVLQALAKFSFGEEQKDGSPARLLGEFDFLSTVSGGGYVGSWLSSWIQRKGKQQVLRQLAHRTAGKIDPEPQQILHLRDYTNYLDPRLGLFSGDTWTLGATTVRNILLNWLVLIPFVAAGLLTPVLFNNLLNQPATGDMNWLLWLGFAFGILGTAFVLHNLPSFGDRRENEARLIVRFLLPLVLTAVCLTLWWRWLPQHLAKHIEAGVHVAHFRFFLFGAAIHASAVILAAALSKISGSPNFRPGTVRFGRLAFAFVAAILTGGLGAWLVSLRAAFMLQLDNAQYACFAVPVVLATLMATGVFSVGVSSKVTNDDDREWWSRAGAWVMVASIGWFVFFSLVLLVPEWVLHLRLRWQASGSIISAALGWYVTKAGAKSEARPLGKGKSAAGSGDASSLVNRVLLPLASILFLAALAVAIVLVNGRIAKIIDERLLFVVELTIAMAASYGVNVNKFSLHAMYRMRLIRAYLGASNPRRDPNPFTGFDPNDNIPMQQLAKEKPLHVLNMCLNLVSGEKLAWQQRKAESFTMTRLHAGSFRVGYQPVTTYGHGKLPGGVTLGTAMTISGAAASPNMGYHSSPLAAIVMTLFNARLGWWLANPGEAGRRFWDRDGPAFGVRPFLDEALGNTDDTNRYIYLSDGGHFENLGIYEMVLRRCKYIVVVDAGADPDYTMEDLGNAVRKIRIDLGISIEFPLGLDIDPELGMNSKRFALGKIRYDLMDEGADPGELLYIKPVMRGNEPADVENYGSANESFPQEPTSDQWFNEAQFESYRRLGAFSIEELVGEPGDYGVPDLFILAAQQLMKEAPMIAKASG